MTQQQKTSKYAGVGKARAQRVGNFIRPGHYIALVNRVEEDEAFKKGAYVAISMTILKTFEDGAKPFDFDRKVELTRHQPGEDISEILMQSNVAFESRLKAFAMVAGDLTDEDFKSEQYDGQTIETLVGPTQPVAGAIVEIRADVAVKREARSKPESALTSADIYTRVGYVRRLGDDEAKALVDATTLARFLPHLAKTTG